MSSIHVLRQLHEIIGASLSVLESAYSEAQLTFPSLDDPYGSDPQAESLTTTQHVVMATNSVIAAAEQLLATVKLPHTSICDAAMGFYLPACLAFVERIHIAEVLQDVGTGGLHVDHIAARTGVDSRKLEHILRLLATHHFFREVTPCFFATNRLSSVIDSGVSYEEIRANPQAKYVGGTGAAALVNLSGDELLKAAAHFPDTVLDSPHISATPPVGSAWSRAFGSNNVFTWLENPGNESRLARIGYAFKGLSQYEDPTAVGTAYDWASLPEGSLVVDVGGGLGYVSEYLYTRFPQLRLLIQDRPGVLSGTEVELKTVLPQALETGHIRMMAHDFMETQPVKDAAVFLIRAVCHNWTDADVVEMFSRLREAAQPDTLLIIGDHVMPYACPDDSPSTDIPGAETSLASSPLLANLGKASAMAYSMDLTMQVVFDCYQRSLREFVELCAKSGWEVVAVRLNDLSRFGYVIARPAQLGASH